MKKILFASTILAASISAAQSAQAEEPWPNWYIGMSAGTMLGEDMDFNKNGTAGTLAYDAGTSYTGTLGYIIPSNATFGSDTDLGRMRVEAELGRKEQRFNVANGGDLEVLSAAVNAVYDFNIDSNVMPYIGAGLGVEKVEATASNPASAAGKDKNTAFYQLMTGLSYAPELMHNTEFTAGYKFASSLDDVSLPAGANPANVELQQHTFEAGVRLRF